MPAAPFFTSANTTPAYELRFHFGWYARGRQPLFSAPHLAELVHQSFSDVTDRYRYHRLDTRLEPHVLRSLLSLRPEMSPSSVTKAIKGNLATAARQTLGITDVWSRGWFVRSNGHVTGDTIREYIASQYDHHRAAPLRHPEAVAVARFHASADAARIRALQHMAFEYNVHVVLVTRRRFEFLDLTVAEKLMAYLREVCRVKEWVPWDIEVVWNHVHLFLGLRPTDAPGDIALALMNNTAWMLHACYEAAIRMDNLAGIWQPSYYVGTAGSATTAQIRAYLERCMG